MVSSTTNPHPAESLEKSLRVFAGWGIMVERTPMDPTPPRDPLADAFAQWRVRPTRNPNFRAAVSERINQAARLTWSNYLRGHLVGWSVAAMLALVAAGWGGRAMAQARLDAGREAMVVSYLSGLDPRVITKLRP
jgi:hypothetical protein